MAENNEGKISNNELLVVNHPKFINVYSIYIDSPLKEPSLYRELYTVLREADETDYFKIHISSPGGRVSIGLDLIHAMKQCEGKVYTIITGPVHSMAPLIALQGDKIYVEDHAFMMFHDYSGGVIGKGHEQESAVLNMKPFFNTVFKELTSGFLTTKEQKEILAGKDLYLKRPEIVRRLKRLGKYAERE